MNEMINGHDPNQPLTPPSFAWWLFRVVFDASTKAPGTQPRVVFVVAIHMHGAIETALRFLGGEKPVAQWSDADVIGCDRSAPVNCITSSVLLDMRTREAQLGAEVH